MAILLLILLVATLVYLWWRRRTTTLTRNCRWRQDRARGDWTCAYCGARTVSEREPGRCLAPGPQQ